MLSAPITVGIADDEPIARRLLRRLLDSDSTVTVVAEWCDGREVVDALAAQPVDVLFLDVRMPRIDGLAALRASPATAQSSVVMVTAHRDHAADAFDVRAVDYLLKPFSDARFYSALARAKQDVTRRRRDLAPAGAATARQGPPPTRRIPVPTERGMRIIVASTIDWVEARDYQCCLHLAAGDLIVRTPLASLEERLDGRQFVRVHRSAIVNIDRVVEVQPYFHGRLVAVLQSGRTLMVSRSRRAAFERAVGAVP